MRFLTEWLNGGNHRQLRGSRRGGPTLALEALETRNLMSSSPLPVLMVLADQRDFYYKEYGDTRQALEAAGLEVAVAAATTRPTIPHANSGQLPGTPGEVVPDRTLAAVNADDYSAIVFVGGWGSSMYQYAYNDPNLDGVTDNFYVDSHYNGDADLDDGLIAETKVVVNDLINDFLVGDKPAAAVCHGVTVLAWARVDGVSPLAGRQVSVPLTVGAPAQLYNGTWSANMHLSGQYDQVVANGGLANTVSGQYGDPTTVADDVIVDGRIITGENFDSAARFGAVIAQEVLLNPPVPPPVSTSGSDLLVTGTDEADTISVWNSATAGEVYVLFNGTSFGPFGTPAVGRVVVHGGSGNDRIDAAGLRMAALIHGEGGRDRITGGRAADLLDGGDGGDRIWGGPGNDWLLGGAGHDSLEGGFGNDVLLGGLGDDGLLGQGGRDFLIGGRGRDGLSGGAGIDRLIGGTTPYDDDPEALAALVSAWLAAGGTDDDRPA